MRTYQGQILVVSVQLDIDLPVHESFRLFVIVLAAFTGHFLLDICFKDGCQVNRILKLCSFTHWRCKTDEIRANGIAYMCVSNAIVMEAARITAFIIDGRTLSLPVAMGAAFKFERQQTTIVQLLVGSNCHRKSKRNVCFISSYYF